MTLEQGIVDKLEAEFDRGRVKVKKIEGRPPAEYLESYDVINKANEVFGYGGWGTQVVNVQMVPVDKKTVCIATVQLDVDGCLPRQDVGAVIAAQKRDKPLSVDALETAVKGAVSDSMKRCFRHFGKQFGNDLYAKDGDGTKRKPAKKAKKAKGTKAQDGFTELWSFAKEHGVANETVQGFIDQCQGDPVAALSEIQKRIDFDEEMPF